MKRFDSLQVPLSGMNLIEASAGTGKTYTITSLYVRLLLEKGLLPEQILVVTFTEAATKEIKERVRARLQAVLYVLQGEQEVGTDDFLAGLSDKYEGDEKVIALLVNAIRFLDLAAIYTIHGFCKRLLSDCAFESGVDFETEFISDNTALLQQIIDDFWRTESPGWGRILSSYLSAKDCSSDSLLNDLQDVVLRTINFGRRILLAPPDRAVADPDEIIGQLAGLWTRERGDIVAALNCGALSQAREKYCAANLVAWFAELDAYFHDPKQVMFPADVFQKFSAETLAAHTKKNKTTPAHRFFDLADNLIQGLKQAYADIRLACIEYCCKELPERKRKYSIMTYEDLLLGVRNGLKSPGSGTAMAEQVRNRYPAALIDEFQDTDPLQFEIFERLYRDTSYCLFLIGDPKQAIYSFRGADVFAYLKASAATINQYTLETNHRSEASLIEAVNNLFEINANAFLFEEIQFHPVRVAVNQAELLLVEGDNDKSLTFWLFEEQSNKNDAKNLLARAVTDKIVRLLNLGRQGNARLGKRALAAGDIAVLVRTHKDGELVRKTLQDKGVPAVIHSGESIYSSAEARDLQFLLAGICYPLDKKKLHAALATSLLGYRAGDFIDIEKNEQHWESILGRFLGYHQQWLEHGFAVMFRTLLEQEGVKERVAGQIRAERCLTNLRHLMDLLQSAVHNEGLGPEELLDWLRAKRHGFKKLEDEDQLRLESDENLVTIATIHKSKGLEYPVVFYPFPWDRFGEQTKNFYAEYHDETKQLRIDLGTANIQQNFNLQQWESLAEELRLLYVAVTRARNRCYLSWGRVGNKRNPVSQRSALGYLLFGSDNGKNGEKRTTVEDCTTPLRSLAAATPRAIGIEDLPEPSFLSEQYWHDQRVFGRSRIFKRELTTSGTIQSFSAIQNRADIEEPDYDAETGFVLPQRPMIPDEESGERSLLSFPRGRRAGSCLHAILEHLDFSAPAGKNNFEMVAGWLRRYGFDDRWAAPVLEGLADVCRTPLPHGDETFCLGDLTQAHRLDELEFYYPVPMLATEKLRAIYSAHMENSFHGGNSKRLSGKALEGHNFMKGFIDLAFEWQGRLFIVDYKSNYLGNRIEDYGPTLLAKAIAESSYDLQYYIYTVTVHRYLRKRLQDNYDYDRYFGGVFYLFIRGMKPERGPKSGIYFDRPSKKRIEALDRYLVPGQLQADYD